MAPDQDTPAEGRFPDGEMRHPAVQVRELHDWHVRLGLPDVELHVDDKDDTKYHAELTRPLPETFYTLGEGVKDAYYTYTLALRRLLAASTNENLDPCYARMPDRALRIALLLASLHDTGSHVIHPQYWARGQAITERLRRDLHHLIGRVEGERLYDETQQPSWNRRLEESLMRQVQRHGPQTLAELARYHKTRSYADMQACAEALVKGGIFHIVQGARQEKYALVVQQDATHTPEPSSCPGSPLLRLPIYYGRGSSYVISKGWAVVKTLRRFANYYGRRS